MDVLSQQKSSFERSIQENGRTIFLTSENILESKNDFCKYIDHKYGKYASPKKDEEPTTGWWDRVTGRMSDRDFETCLDTYEFHRAGLNHEFTAALLREKQRRIDKILLQED